MASGDRVLLQRWQFGATCFEAVVRLGLRQARRANLSFWGQPVQPDYLKSHAPFSNLGLTTAIVMMCPCCTDTLLRHASASGVYWFCPTCRQAMPLLRRTTSRSRSSVARIHHYNMRQG